MAKLNPSSVNTMRIDTFIDKEGRCEILSGYLRMSITGSPVDNVSSGGCYVGIDMLNGTLRKFGYSSITKSDGRYYTKHPSTGVVFEGFQIPDFGRVKELVMKFACLIPALRLIGWDIAIADDGPVMIEGNSGYDMTISDMTYGGYGKNPVFRRVLTELNETRYLTK